MTAISNPPGDDAILPEPAPAKRILFADCDAFFAQVARLGDPQGIGKTPLLIAGDSATERRGNVVTPASHEARGYGVNSAMLTAHALHLCPNATLAGSARTNVGSAAMNGKRPGAGVDPGRAAAVIKVGKGRGVSRFRHS